MSSSRLLVLALLALQPWSGAARHLRGRRRLDAADDVAVPPEIREALNDAVDAVVDDGGLYSDDKSEPPLTPTMEDVVERTQAGVGKGSASPDLARKALDAWNEVREEHRARTRGAYALSVEAARRVRARVRRVPHRGHAASRLRASTSLVVSAKP